MLKLAFIFDDAVRVMAAYSHRLAILPLPATVYLMQVDVLNHYRYALDHYFNVPLDAPFLQNSSHGTPYQKWAFFTNEDFGLLSFAIHNLLRYTSRLIYESECVELLERKRYAEMKRAGNAYISPIIATGHGGKSIGITIQSDHELWITTAQEQPRRERFLSQESDGVMRYYRVVPGSDGTEQEQPISHEEYQRMTAPIGSVSVDIKDRARLAELWEQGSAELAELKKRNHAMKQACDEFYRIRPVAEPFEKLNESFWI